MSKRAEEKALEIFPVKKVFNYGLTRNAYSERDANLDNRALFCMGYEQAEKDIIAIIESRIAEILGDAQPKPTIRIELKELITRIKEGAKK